MKWYEALVILLALLGMLVFLASGALTPTILMLGASGLLHHLTKERF